MKKYFGLVLLLSICFLKAEAIDNKGITFGSLSPDRFTLLESGTPNAILVDEQEDAGVKIAAGNLSEDFKRVSGKAADLQTAPGSGRMVIVGTLKSRYIKELAKAKKIDASQLEGKNRSI